MNTEEAVDAVRVKVRDAVPGDLLVLPCGEVVAVVTRVDDERIVGRFDSIGGLLRTWDKSKLPTQKSALPMPRSYAERIRPGRPPGVCFLMRPVS